MRGRRPASAAQAGLLPVDARDHRDLRPVAAIHLFQRRRYFADCGLGPRRIDRKRQEIAVAAGGGAGQGGECFGDRLRIALALEAGELVDLQLAHRGIVDLEQLDFGVATGAIAVDADHRLPAGIDTGLRSGRGLLDAPLR